MGKRTIHILALGAWVGVALLSAVAGAETIRVGVAISLKEAMVEIARDYEADSGDAVELTFGSSGQIAAQIRSGADIDVFISAANKQVDDLVGDKLVDAVTRTVVATNTLVLVVPPDVRDAPARFEDLAGAAVKKVAVGEPKTVPAGQYARQVLDALRLTDALRGKLVYGTNVRQVLLYVERAEVSAGIVYATDARQSGDKVKIVATADETLHEPIVYPGVTVSASRKPEAGKRFLEYLTGGKAQATLKSKGFFGAASKTE